MVGRASVFVVRGLQDAGGQLAGVLFLVEQCKVLLLVGAQHIFCITTIDNGS